MSARFAEAAGRLAGFAGVVLGWSPEVFWSATPAELTALVAVFGGEGSGGGALDGAGTARLMEAFPDG